MYLINTTAGSPKKGLGRAVSSIAASPETLAAYKKVNKTQQLGRNSPNEDGLRIVVNDPSLELTSGESSSQEELEVCLTPASTQKNPFSPLSASVSKQYTPRSSRKQQAQYNRGKDWVEMVKSLPGNSTCIDCGAKNPEWCCVSFGTLVCLECASNHRSLGVNISRVLVHFQN